VRRAQAQRLQAATATLHEDVLLAEARLRRIRAVNDVSASSGTGTGAAPPQAAWVRRALARTASADDEDVLGSPAANARRPHAERAPDPV
jgi:hypothetical protein